MVQKCEIIGHKKQIIIGRLLKSTTALSSSLAEMEISFSHEDTLLPCRCETHKPSAVVSSGVWLNEEVGVLDVSFTVDLLNLTLSTGHLSPALTFTWSHRSGCRSVCPSVHSPLPKACRLSVGAACNNAQLSLAYTLLCCSGFELKFIWRWCIYFELKSYTSSHQQCILSNSLLLDCTVKAINGSKTLFLLWFLFGPRSSVFACQEG